MSCSTNEAVIKVVAVELCRAMHRKEVFHPLHGRISSQRATISGYGIDWEKDAPLFGQRA
jgi:hypothetical protein